MDVDPLLELFLKSLIDYPGPFIGTARAILREVMTSVRYEYHDIHLANGYYSFYSTPKGEERVPLPKR